MGDRGCEHAEAPRRVCDLCDRADGPFLTCSLACLRTHLDAEHPEAGAGTSAERAAAYVARVNRNVAGNREWYADHRARVTELLMGAARGGALCVLGAGNGSDLELEALGAAYGELHLVDLDAAALERCRAGAPEGVRERLVLHGGVDLSGFVERLDDWGERFPAEAELGKAALPAIHGVLGKLGRRFDVVVSTCALSQLAVPYHRAWILPAASWAHLHAAVAAVHLATVAGATEPGGTGMVVFDVLSSRVAPGLRETDGAALEAFAERHVAQGGRLDPSPTGLLARLADLGRLIEAPRLTPPWLWNIGAETQLVYSLVFRRR